MRTLKLFPVSSWGSRRRDHQVWHQVSQREEGLLHLPSHQPACGGWAAQGWWWSSALGRSAPGFQQSLQVDTPEGWPPSPPGYCGGSSHNSLLELPWSPADRKQQSELAQENLQSWINHNSTFVSAFLSGDRNLLSKLNNTSSHLRTRLSQASEPKTVK